MTNRSGVLVPRAGLATILAALLAACGVTGAVVGPQSWTVGATDDAGNSISVDVSDRSGVVRDIALDPPDAEAVLGVSAVPGSLDTIDVSWAGNGCDQHATLEIAAAGGGIGITVRVDPSRVPCDNGVVRTMRLMLRKAIPPAMVVFRRDAGA